MLRSVDVAIILRSGAVFLLTQQTAISSGAIRAQWLLAIGLALPFISGISDSYSPPDSSVLLNRLPARWRADDGKILSLDSLKGQRIFVAMAYATCHRVCPTTMARLKDLQRDLDAQRISAVFLIVSYDPINDDAAAWRRYRTSHGLLRDNWHFLNGSVADTERLARMLGFAYWRDGDHVMHDYRFVALDRSGAERGVITSAHHDLRDLL